MTNTDRVRNLLANYMLGRVSNDEIRICTGEPDLSEALRRLYMWAQLIR
jgi:hypothetical protein